MVNITFPSKFVRTTFTGMKIFYCNTGSTSYQVIIDTTKQFNITNKEKFNSLLDNYTNGFFSSSTFNNLSKNSKDTSINGIAGKLAYGSMTNNQESKIKMFYS